MASTKWKLIFPSNKWLQTSFLGAIATCTTYTIVHNQESTTDANKRYFTRKQINEADGTDGKPTYVTFKGFVLDVSEFKKIHPGGNFINQAAGSDIEPFWNKWRYHYHTKKVKDTLEELKIGYLLEENEKNEENEENEELKYNKEDNITLTTEGLYKEEIYSQEEDMYNQEPLRSNEHKILIQKPFTSETKPEILKQNYLTSSSALYIRNHAPVPSDLDINDHEIMFTNNNDDVIDTISISNIIQKYTSNETNALTNIVSVLQCAGNRAAEDIIATGPTGFVGTPYETIESGMVGNVLWSGVYLKDVMMDQYPKECQECMNDTNDTNDTNDMKDLHSSTSSNKSIWHVIFQGADEYETSTPLSHVLNNESKCLLATKMNDEILSHDHGYPIRAVLPGVAGARNVKWLESIKVSKIPSNSPWNEYYYKEANGEAIQKLPMNSMILSPANGSIVCTNDGSSTINIEGIAYSGGSGNKIRQVEVSIDQGKTWFEVELLLDEIIHGDSDQSFGWVRWNVKMKVEMEEKKENKMLTIWCRATDDKGEIQPRTSPKQRGYLYNGYNQINVGVRRD